MKKGLKALVALLVGVSMVGSVAAFAGCSDSSDEATDDHTHTESTDYATYNGKQYKVCTECGELIGEGTAVAEHTHTAGTEYAAYGDKHYQVCTSCGELIGEGTAHSKAEGSEYVYNSTRHWYICSDCGAKVEDAAHTLVDSNTADYVHEGVSGKECSVCGYTVYDDSVSAARTPVTAKTTDSLSATGATSTIGDETASTENITSVQLTWSGNLGVDIANTLDLDFSTNKAKLKSVMTTGGMSFTMVAATAEDCTETYDAWVPQYTLIGEGAITGDATNGYTVTFNVPEHSKTDSTTQETVTYQASVIVITVTKSGAVYTGKIDSTTTTNTDLSTYFYMGLTGATAFKSASVSVDLTWNMTGTSVDENYNVVAAYKAPVCGESNVISSAKLTIKVDGQDDYVVEDLTFGDPVIGTNTLNGLIQYATYTGKNESGDTVVVTLNEDGSVSATVTSSKLTGNALVSAAA